MFNLLQDFCYCGRLVLLLSVAGFKLHKLCFIKCFYEKFIEHKITQAFDQNLYFPLIDSDN